MTAVATTKQQPPFCLFPPVAKLVRPSILRFKLRMQLHWQSYIVPPSPISSTQAINGKITHWLPGYIEERLFLEMCENAPIVDDPGILGKSKKANDGDKKINYYYLEAAKYAGRISAGNFDDGANAKYKPVFELHYNDFTTRLQEELKLLLKDSPDTLRRVVQNAVFRIFKARHKLIFYDYIENEDLNWRFASAN